MLLRIERKDGLQIYPFPTQFERDDDDNIVYKKDDAGNDIKGDGKKVPIVRDYAWAAVPIGTNWEPGKRYIYTLNFINGAGWVDPKDPDNPDELIRGPIEFTVTVQEWKDATTDDDKINIGEDKKKNDTTVTDGDGSGTSTEGGDTEGGTETPETPAEGGE